jgi:cell division initiation protein
MALTPVEIRHIRLRKALFGYQVGQTDDLLADVVTSFEDVWRDRADLADKIEQLEAELVRYRELEQLLRTTLISAERASQQMTDQARRETESVLSEARAEAREIVREAMAERERLNIEVDRIKAQLGAVLATIGGEPVDEAPAPSETTFEVPPSESPSPAGAPPLESWGENASPEIPRAERPPAPDTQARPVEQATDWVVPAASVANGFPTPTLR